ncbi:MAG: hypothetical protein K0R18_2890 [Bacillales bacterium]|nr:hypothetical protein [Bacillales bacterium]
MDEKIIMLLIPIILVEFALKFYCCFKLYKKNSTKLLNKPVWFIIIIAISLLGSISYLIIEERHE